MIKNAELLKDLSLAALDKLHTELHKESVEGMTALELYAWLQRLGTLTELLRNRLVPEANASFDKLKLGAEKQNMWRIGDFAAVVVAEPPTSWVYPVAALDQMTAARAALEQTKLNGTAQQSIGRLDPKSVATFVVDLRTV